MHVVFYEDGRGARPARQYLLRVYQSGERPVIASFEQGQNLLAEYGVGVTMPNARIINRRERVYELRFGDHRIAFVAHNGEIVLPHGWRKCGQKLDTGEAARALRYATDWRTRFPSAEGAT